ncbi:recombinase family protein [Streptomyces sp. NPDC088730]|uniref:recombinase family protein n=1 Tax=Streptomyces sp. NPDC088730 TaxID=3365877 RepID=UPI00380BD316
MRKSAPITDPQQPFPTDRSDADDVEQHSCPKCDARPGSTRSWGPACPRDKIFAGKISTRIRVRPKSEEGLRTAREVKAHAPHCRVTFTVYEMKRLGRDAAELTALADHLTAHGLILEILAGPPPGIYDPAGPGKLLLAFFAAMAETERENIRESSLEGLDTAGPEGQERSRR